MGDHWSENMIQENAKDYFKLEPRLPSREMRAVLTIIAADPELDRLTTPWLDIEREAIHWADIFESPMSSGHRSALEWARALWTEQFVDPDSILDSSLNMDLRLKGAVLRALALMWGIWN